MSLMEYLKPRLRVESSPGDGPYHSLDAEGIRLAADFLGTSLTGAMAACLEQGIWPLRFCRNRGLFSAEEQARLLQSHVLHAGCGGLGGAAIILLARLGIGRMTLCDPDVFCESNLNRQSLCREDRLGMNKAIAGKEELRCIASHIQVRAVPEALTQENIAPLLYGVGGVVDGLDTLEARRVVLQGARKAGVPYVYGALAGQEGFACLEDADTGPILDTVLSTPPRGSLAEHRLGTPTLTPTATAVMQCLLAVRAILGTPSGRTDGLPARRSSPLWYLDLSVAAVEKLAL